MADVKAKEGSSPLRALLVSLLILAGMFVFLVYYAYRTAPSPGKQISLDAVYRLADRNELISVTLYDEDAQIVGKRCLRPIFIDATGSQALEPKPPKDPTAPSKCIGEVEQFHTSYPRSDVATQQLIQRVGAVEPLKAGEDPNQVKGARVAIDKQTNKSVAKLVSTFVLPLLLLANLFGLIFFSSSSDQSIADIAGFGTIRKKAQKKRQTGPGVSFADVAGAQESVAELKEVVEYLSDPKKFEAYGAAPPKGVLLFGPPGCGKTLLARAVAGESQVPFFSISGAEFIESLVGVGAARVRDLFRQVREQAPAIVFIDEIDAVGRKRSGEGNSGGEREQTVNQLLVELDGFDVSSGVVLMGATNRPDILDPALLRPGRFDRHVTLEVPDVNGRQAILELHAKSKPMDADVDFALLARRTPGFTGADLANVVNEGALLAIREGNEGQIQMRHLIEAVHRVLHGPQRRGRIMLSEERHRLAYHEAGHALVAASLGHDQDVQRISIVSRGKSLAAVSMEQAERSVLTATEMKEQLTMTLAGIATERLIFGESSTTAKDDIDKATELAREMVGVYGMSDELGLVRMIRLEDGYLGGEGAMEVLSGQTLSEFEAEVRRLIDGAEQAANELLQTHRLRLDQLAAALEEKETLEAQDLIKFLSDVRPSLAAAPAKANHRPKAPSRSGPKGARV